MTLMKHEAHSSTGTEMLQSHPASGLRRSNKIQQRRLFRPRNVAQPKLQAHKKTFMKMESLMENITSSQCGHQGEVYIVN